MRIHFYTRFIKPQTKREDDRRREFILNILLAAAASLFFLAYVVSIIADLTHPAVYKHNAVSFLILFILLVGSIGLYVLSRRGHIRTASYILISFLLLLAAYMGYDWGFDVPASALFYVLIIVMTGVLLDTRSAFVITGFISIVIAITGYLQIEGIVEVDSFWKLQSATYTDVIMTIIVFFIIATIAWLSNREIEKSLHRAKRSEADLMRERDLLEVRIRERTEELRNLELERMAQTYRFVEFGRLASGLFHDLANPLTALSFTIDSIAHGAREMSDLTHMAEEIGRAQSTTSHITKLMDSMRRHLAHKGSKELFSLRTLLNEVVHVMKSYARQRLVHLNYINNGIDVSIYGDSIACIQIVTNIVSNAIESFMYVPRSHEKRNVTISFTCTGDIAVLTITDTGMGIPEDVLPTIFEPFYSTKGNNGLGIGLSLAKRLLEKEFDGSISVESKEGFGTAFTIYLPVREP